MKKLMFLLSIIIGLILMIAGLVQINGDSNQSSQAEPISKLSQAIREDLLNLERQKQLPIEWFDIAEEKTLPTSSLTSRWMAQVKTNVEIHKNGKYRLQEIIIGEDPNSENSRLLIQYEIYEKASDNKVWEIVRIYNPI